MILYMQQPSSDTNEGILGWAEAWNNIYFGKIHISHI